MAEEVRGSVHSTALLNVALLVFVFVSAFFMISGVDIGFHVRTGAEVIETGRIPSTNTFAFTVPDHPWLLQQWWPGVLFYLVFSRLGVAGLIVLKGLLVAGAFGVTLMTARRVSRRHSVWPLWAVTAAVVLARSRFFVRPFLFSALLFALLMLLDQQFARKRRWQWCGLPLLMALWANTHAGVVYGFVYLILAAGVEWLEWAFASLPLWRRQAAGIQPPARLRLLVRPAGLLLSVLAAWLSLEGINPSGARVMLLPLVYFTDPFWQAVIMEFSPLTWDNGKGFYLSLVVLALLQACTQRSPRLQLAVPAWVFALMAMRSQRCVLFYALAAVPYAAFMLERIWAGRPVRNAFHACALCATWLALVFALFVRDPVFRFGVGLYPRFHPMEIYGFMRREVPPQNVFHNMRYGAGILWWLYPDFRPFIDGRCEAYPKAFWRDEYLAAERGDAAWVSIFGKYDIHGALLRVTRSESAGRLMRTLFADPGWALVAYNDDVALFLERTVENQGVIAWRECRLVWPGDPDLSGVSPANAAEARRDVLRALAVAPDCVFARAALARIDLTLGRYAQAADGFSVLAGEQDLGHAFRRDYGYALYMAGRTDEAGSIFDRMIHEGRDAAYARYMKHLVLMKGGNIGAAGEQLRLACEQEPANPEYRAAHRAWREAFAVAPGPGG